MTGSHAKVTPRAGSHLPSNRLPPEQGRPLYPGTGGGIDRKFVIKVTRYET